MVRDLCADARRLRRRILRRPHLLQPRWGAAFHSPTKGELRFVEPIGVSQAQEDGRTMKRVDAEVLTSLKEALAVIYWYKQDLNTFLRATLSDTNLLGGVNWDTHKKREAIDIVINRIAKAPERHRDDLVALIVQVCGMSDFSHLLYLDEGKSKEARALAAVQALKAKAGKVKEFVDEQAQSTKRKRQIESDTQHASLFRDALARLGREFNEMAFMEESQERGYKLERILQHLFELFDLDPKASFKIRGEQIDGAFSFEGTDFLLEARWRKSPTGVCDLDAFAQKVQRKLDNTLGLFVSISGYTRDGIEAYSHGRKVLLLLDGPHLAAVFEGRLRLDDLLLRARRHASQTGQVYLPLQEIF